MRSQDLKEALPELEVVLALPPEDLASFLLPILPTQREQPALYRVIYAMNHPSPMFGPNDNDAACKAVAEAWAWMLAQGIVADAGQPGDGQDVFITRKGQQLVSDVAFSNYKKAALLPRALLHSRIVEKAWPTFMRGDYETAVFQAFKEVEVAVRDAARFDAQLLGTDLMRRAFNVDSGPLTNLTAIPAEREALAHLFAGAIGSYKNPTSHRTVAISDPVEAGEMLILASHLLRIAEDRSAKSTIC